MTDPLPTGSTTTSSGSDDTAGDATQGDTSSTSEGSLLDPDLEVWISFEGGLEGGAVDASDRNRTVACGAGPTSCPSEAAGVFGAAGVFDAVDDGLRIESDDGLQSEAFTVFFWMRVSVYEPQQRRVLVSQPSGLNTTSWEAHILEAGSGIIPEFLFGYGDVGKAQRVQVGLGAMGEGMWFPVALLWDGAEMRVWINDTLSDPVPIVGQVPPPSGDLVVGAAAGPGQTLINNFNGLIDDFRVYSRILTREEIEAIALTGE